MDQVKRRPGLLQQVGVPGRSSFYNFLNTLIIVSCFNFFSKKEREQAKFLFPFFF
jgi:hypothetical protein